MFMLIAAPDVLYLYLNCLTYMLGHSMNIVVTCVHCGDIFRCSIVCSTGFIKKFGR